MVPMVYQAYPGGPQQVYYVPAAQGSAHSGMGVMAGLESKIRQLASTDKLEGFSLRDLFKETFTKRGEDAIEDYLSVGSPRTTPPLELVDTNWPKPWMFFRVLAGLAIAYAVVYALFLYTLNEKVMITIIVLATFAVPVATMTLLWEMNAPRNVSIAKLIEVFVVGGGLSIVFATLWYLIPIFGNLPGIVEETSKLVAVILVTYSVRGTRYPYQLNGVLFGAAVGAGFACSETLGYGLDVVLQFIQGGGLQQVIAANPQGVSLSVVLETLLKPVVSELNMRALLSPFGHPMFTAISAGAFFRVKGDRPASASMLLDGRFLRAFLIPVVLHEVWDSPLAAGSSNAVIQWVGEGAVAVIGWYVVFTMIQQGLHQVRDMQKAQLEHTLQHVEATLGLGTVRPPMSPVPVAPVA
jgi:RsiW-degrading membrane proteinase PrsW (M82 family)